MEPEKLQKVRSLLIEARDLLFGEEGESRSVAELNMAESVFSVMYLGAEHGMWEVDVEDEEEPE